MLSLSAARMLANKSGVPGLELLKRHCVKAGLLSLCKACARIIIVVVVVLLTGEVNPKK